MIARTTGGTHNARISAQTVTHRLREIGERPPYTMYVLYAAFLFWPSICTFITCLVIYLIKYCFSRVFTVCQSTPLEVFSIQSVKCGYFVYAIFSIISCAG